MISIMRTKRKLRNNKKRKSRTKSRNKTKKRYQKGGTISPEKRFQNAYTDKRQNYCECNGCDNCHTEKAWRWGKNHRTLNYTTCNRGVMTMFGSGWTKTDGRWRCKSCSGVGEYKFNTCFNSNQIIVLTHQEFKAELFKIPDGVCIIDFVTYGVCPPSVVNLQNLERQSEKGVLQYFQDIAELYRQGHTIFVKENDPHNFTSNRNIPLAGDGQPNQRTLKRECETLTAAEEPYEFTEVFKERNTLLCEEDFHPHFYKAGDIFLNVEVRTYDIKDRLDAIQWISI